MAKVHYHNIVEVPSIAKMLLHPEKGFLFWYSHLFLGIPIKPYIKEWAKPEMSREVAMELKHWHFKWSLLPEYDNYGWDGTPDPILRMANNVHKGVWTAVEAGTSLGKTWAASIIALHRLHTRRGGTVSCLGVSFEHLRDTLWPEIEDKWNRSDDKKYGVQKLLPFASKMKSCQIICEDVDEPKWKLSLKGVKVPKGGEKSAGGTQGRHNEWMLFLVDEAAKVANSVLTGLINTCTDLKQNTILCMGNPDNVSDALHQFSKRRDVDAIRLSALDHPNVVCKRKVIGGGAVTIESVYSRLTSPDIHPLEETDPFFQSRVRGISPENSKLSYIKREELDRALNWIPDVEDDGIYVGIDPSNSESGDPAGFTMIEGATVTQLFEFPCPYSNAIAYNLLYSDEKLLQKLEYFEGRPREIKLPNYNLPNLRELGVIPTDVTVDCTGVGEGTVNTFLEHEFPVHKFYAGGSVAKHRDVYSLHRMDDDGKPILECYNWRTLAFFLLVWDLRYGKLGFDRSIRPETIEFLYLQLAAYRIKPRTSSNAVMLESKRKTMANIVGGKSPNLADSLMAANFVRNYNLYSFEEGTDY
ncbi:MAG: hypothetical protein AAFO96_03790 [Bacteroidota bacterium]